MDKYFGPWETEIHVTITDGKDNFGKVSIGMGHAQIPTIADYQEALAKIPAAIPEGWHIASKKEWFRNLSLEEFGCACACPGSDEWDKEPVSPPEQKDA